MLDQSRFCLWSFQILIYFVTKRYTSFTESLKINILLHSECFCLSDFQKRTANTKNLNRSSSWQLLVKRFSRFIDHFLFVKADFKVFWTIFERVFCKAFGNTPQHVLYRLFWTAINRDVFGSERHHDYDCKAVKSHNCELPYPLEVGVRSWTSHRKSYWAYEDRGEEEAE